MSHEHLGTKVPWTTADHQGIIMYKQIALKGVKTHYNLSVT